MEKITKLCIGTLAFIFLFYHQGAGLNAGIMGLIAWLLLFMNRIKNQNQKEFWFLSVCIFLSAFSFAWYGDAFSFFAMFVSIIVLGFKSQYPRINIMLYPFLWFLNYAGFIFKFFSFKYWLPGKIAGNNFFKKVLALVMIPLFFVVLFIIVYASGSEIFYSFFQKLFFYPDFFEIVFLAGLGFFLFFNIWFVFIPRVFIKINNQLSVNFSPHKQINLRPTFSFLEIDFERRSGEITLILLNILLLFFIATYNYEQFFSIHKTATLSEEIHQRVAMIIFSIILAIGVIMFYFKSSFNFDQKAGLLKKSAYVWIILNALLIISAFTKNTEYILVLGLTFKRIGVYIFLGLSLVGLFITYLKLHFAKTNIFLLNRMLLVFFVTFILTSCINFSWVVTKYNIAFHKNDDIEYLKKLDFNKQILYNNYKNDPLWKSYFDNEKEMIKEQRSKSILSWHLYIQSLHIE